MFHRYVIELAAKLPEVQRNLSVRKRVLSPTLRDFVFNGTTFLRCHFNFHIALGGMTDVANESTRASFWEEILFFKGLNYIIYTYIIENSLVLFYLEIVNS